MSASSASPLSRLVLFMVCLSIAGIIVAGAHYYAVDLPGQQNTKAPANLLVDFDQCMYMKMLECEASGNTLDECQSIVYNDTKAQQECRIPGYKP